MRVTVPSFDRTTLVEVRYPGGHRIGLRGSHAPLSWEQTREAEHTDGDRYLFQIEVPRGEILELKVVRDDDWAAGRNYAVHGGDHLYIEPAFDRTTSRLVDAVGVDVRDGKLPIEVLLPPSYDEQTQKRYPLLYALDGQALFATSQDPFGVWCIERSLDALYDLSAIDEVVLVAVHTSERRLERLSPVEDPAHGGGDGRAFLEDLIEIVDPYIRGRYRVRDDDTGILGSSMGGLFAFFAAFTRPDIFRRAACLSSSFWWANRWAPRFVAASDMPENPPILYIDSGAARDPADPDPHVRDGFHHTRSMFRALVRGGYTPGNLHRMVFPGHAHEPAAWGARVSTPLQLLYPNTHVTLARDA